MQVKGTAPSTVRSVSVACSPLDFESTGDAVVQFAPVVTLSREDLIAALSLAQVDPARLAAMSVEQVRYEVAFVLATDGLSAVHQAVYSEANARFVDAGTVAYRALCAERINAAFGLAAPVVRRSRIGDVVARQRRIVVRAA